VARPRARLAALDIYDAATLALLAALVVLAFATADSYAISNDEPVQQRYGELIVAYYASGFTDTSLFHFENLYLYGGLFDLAAVGLQHLLPWFEPYWLRHILCALIGIAGIGFACATARLVAGPRAGAIAAFFLTACGPWYGGMFNHTKDIPFAAAMIGAAYFLIRAARELPHPRRRNIVGFGLLLGAALGIRVLGLLTVGYAGIAILMAAARLPSPTWRARLDFFARAVLAFLPAFVIAYLIMIAAWPWSALAPLNPIRGLVDFGHFHYPIQTLLAGKIYEMATVPRWYVPVYLAIKLPLLMLAGFAVAAVLAMLPGKPTPEQVRRRLESALLVFIAAFPVICEVIDHGPAFTGMRHFLFVVPVVAALAGVGFDGLLNALSGRWRLAATGAAAAILAGLAWNTVLLVRLHPYEYLYYNPLVGGLQGAARRYATDYWVNIMPEAVDDLEAYVARIDPNSSRRYTVAICGEALPFEKEANARLKLIDEWDDAEFFIAPTHMNCDRALNGQTIATISRLGVPIGVVKDRRALVRAALARHR
jgi:hypothetical protein